jgi:hypothetical protein
MKELFKIILNLIVNKAPRRQWYLNIGAHFLRKGAGYEIGQIVKLKKLEGNRYRGHKITGLFYDFDKNQITHTASKTVVRIKK